MICGSSTLGRLFDLKDFRFKGALYFFEKFILGKSFLNQLYERSDERDAKVLIFFAHQLQQEKFHLKLCAIIV
jgi:hypothetical protein